MIENWLHDKIINSTLVSQYTTKCFPNYVPSTQTPIISAVTLPAGVWFVEYSARIQSSPTTTITDFYTWISNSTSGSNKTFGLNQNGSIVQTVTNSGLCTTGSSVIVSDGTTTYTVITYYTFTGGPPILVRTSDLGSVVKRTRIA